MGENEGRTMYLGDLFQISGLNEGGNCRINFLPFYYFFIAENVPPYVSEKGLLFNQSPIGSACLNSEKRNLDRSQFGGAGQLNWQSNKDGTKRGNGKEAKAVDNCGKRRSPKGIAAGEGAEGGDGTNFVRIFFYLIRDSISSMPIQFFRIPLV
jgi:hypothetical protein